MSESNVKKIMFAPGVLEQLEADYDPEELQEIMDEIRAAVESGTMFEESEVIDMDALQVEDPDLYNILQTKLLELNTEDSSPITNKHLLH